MSLTGERPLSLPPGLASPYFICELALEMGKTLRELGGGPPGMDIHELTVIWPAFFATRAKVQRWQAKQGD